MQSRVVPGTSDTTSRCWRTSRLMYDDFPAFGRPTTTTRSGRSPSAAAPPSGSFGRCGSAISSSPSMPRPCSADTAAIGYPSTWKSSVRSSSSGTSALLAATTTGRPLRLSSRATSTSIGWSPALRSTTSTTAAASSMATRTCAAVAAWKASLPSFAPSMSASPPVSMTRNR